ncbi:MAG: AAA family ATPase [Bacteroidota bacterium]
MPLHVALLIAVVALILGVVLGWILSATREPLVIVAGEEGGRESGIGNRGRDGETEGRGDDETEAQSTEGRDERSPPHGDTATPPHSGTALAPTELPDHRTTEPLSSLDACLEALEDAIAYNSTPGAVRSHPAFAAGVALLADEPLGKLRAMADESTHSSDRERNRGLLALDALRVRPDVSPTLAGGLVPLVSQQGTVAALFMLDTVAAHAAERPVAGDLLARLDDSWASEPDRLHLLAFLDARHQAGDPFTVDDGTLDGRNAYDVREETLPMLDRLDAPGKLGKMVKRVAERLTDWERQQVNTAFLNGIGRVIIESGPYVSHPTMVTDVDAMVRSLTAPTPRSVIVTGESGSGRTTTIRVLETRLRKQGWTIFEASATDLMAGQMYIGQLEERITNLLKQIAGRPVLWVAPHLGEFVHAGQYREKPTGALDMLLPAIRRGSVRIVSEVTPEAYRQLIRERPQVRALMDTVEIEPMAANDAQWLVTRWVMFTYGGGAFENADVLPEARALAEQVLPKVLPGALFDIVKLVLQRRQAKPPADISKTRRKLRITREDVLAAVASLTGLPNALLDDRTGLDLDGLRTHFEGRVLGQPEAVDVLVDRVALLKAGLTDPTRPYGVFLFVGPTGTGKTEIDKALAAYLFGAEDRMIRLDMSEFQTADALDRLLGTAEGAHGPEALVDQVRKQPFAVVLLDEFEKAAPAVWDLFLQVFDDGRLTDRRGATTDFRHTIVILTSNVGSRVATRPGLGFGNEPASFASGTVQQRLEGTFRKEFLNRLDRIVVFQPLRRPVMRKLLDLELAKALDRRGLRHRGWAVEFDAAALEFLLDEGFTPDLGARPLKRAVERHLLTPLARTIVAHAAPEGDQFLFVRGATDATGRGGLEVEFVDPDADDGTPLPNAEDVGETLEAVALDAQGTPAELVLVLDQYDALAAAVDDPTWEETKAHAYARMADGTFWSDPDRFETLGRVEFMDRIEAGIDTADSLLDRLEDARAKGNATLPRSVMQRVAHQLFLLREALATLEEQAPRAAVVRIEAEADDAAWAGEVAGMYQRWAAHRRMRLDVIAEPDSTDGPPFRRTFAVSGFGAWRLLHAEAGLHVYETPKDGDKNGYDRAVARVAVVPCPEPLPAAPAERAVVCQEALDAGAEPGRPEIVRRYRKAPSPLVRDAVRGWRSGRLDRVLDGHFDLIGAGG